MQSLLQPRSISDVERTLKLARETLAIEADAVHALSLKLGDAFLAAHRLLYETVENKGRVVVTGMGKSGHIAGKIASTLASTGTPAFFMHPGEASHGDLGMITPHDVVLALSNSGENDELLMILPTIKRLGVPLIGLSGNANSSLAKLADGAGMPIHHLALLWCLQNPHVSTVILGASRVSQLTDNLTALDRKSSMTPDLMAAIENVVQNKPEPAQRF